MKERGRCPFSSTFMSSLFDVSRARLRPRTLYAGCEGAVGHPSRSSLHSPYCRQDSGFVGGVRGAARGFGGAGGPKQRTALCPRPRPLHCLAPGRCPRRPARDQMAGGFLLLTGMTAESWNEGKASGEGIS